MSLEVVSFSSKIGKLLLLLLVGWLCVEFREYWKVGLPKVTPPRLPIEVPPMLWAGSTVRLEFCRLLLKLLVWIWVEFKSSGSCAANSGNSSVSRSGCSKSLLLMECEVVNFLLISKSMIFSIMDEVLLGSWAWVADGVRWWSEAGGWPWSDCFWKTEVAGWQMVLICWEVSEISDFEKFRCLIFSILVFCWTEDSMVSVSVG